MNDSFSVRGEIAPTLEPSAFARLRRLPASGGCSDWLGGTLP